MKSRHGIAFALVGWYLLCPPPDADKRTPLKEWINLGSYDKAKDCADDRTKQMDFWLRPKAEKLLYKRATLNELRHSVCIATDDPRLNGD